MLRFFRSKPAPIWVMGVGEFRYFKDRDDEYWELASDFASEQNGIDLTFCCISGDQRGMLPSARELATKLLDNPERLWTLADGNFLAHARVHHPDVDESRVREHFCIASLSVNGERSFEFGLHSRSFDVFYELFVRSGVVQNIETDEGCCAIT